MHKIQSVSRFFKWIFQLTFLVLPILLIVFWIQAPYLMTKTTTHYGFIINYLPKLPANSHISLPLANNTKLLGFIINLIPLSASLLILYYLIRLFKNFEVQNIFSSCNVRYIQLIGYILFIDQLILNPIYQGLLSAVLTWHNPPGKRIISINFSGINLGILLTALLIVLIAWIINEGYQLKEEQQYTV